MQRTVLSVVLLLGVLPMLNAQVSYDIHQGKQFEDLEEALKYPDRVFHLKLSGKELTSVPEAVYAFSNLLTLDLSDNEIKSLDGMDFSSFKKLVALDLSRNRLTSFPQELLVLTNLQHLNLGFNRMRSVGNDISKMKYLVELHLPYTGLKEFPDRMALNYLEVLRLDGNMINHIPDLALKALPRLVSLNINNNMMIEVPASLYSSKIERLNLGGNKIRGLEKLGEMEGLTELIADWNTLSPEAVQQIGSLDKLTILSMEHCAVRNIPEVFSDLDRLEEWSLVGNEITILPPLITEMKGLEKLWLSGNPMDRVKIENLQRAMPEATILF